MDLLREVRDDNPSTGAQATAGRKLGPSRITDGCADGWPDRVHESVPGLASLLRLARVMLYGRGQARGVPSSYENDGGSNKGRTDGGNDEYPLERPVARGVV